MADHRLEELVSICDRVILSKRNGRRLDKVGWHQIRAQYDDHPDVYYCTPGLDEVIDEALVGERKRAKRRKENE